MVRRSRGEGKREGYATKEQDGSELNQMVSLPYFMLMQMPTLLLTLPMFVPMPMSINGEKEASVILWTVSSLLKKKEKSHDEL